MHAPRDNRMRLKDGRSLGYAEHGDPHGKPVFVFHGTPGSRRLRHPDDSIALSLGARIITIDRPGYGFSDGKPGRTLLDWPDDVVELADALGIERFAVAGFSGGGPHAAACAYKIESRLTAVALVSSLAPFDSRNVRPIPLRLVHVSFRVAKISPLLLQIFGQPFVSAARKDFDSYLDRIANRLPECDRLVLQRPEVKQVFRESFIEIFRQGSRAAAEELSLLVRPWGFRLEEIRRKVYLWHGEQDPFHKAGYLTAALQNCEAAILPEEGHLLLFNHWREILAQIK